MDVYVVGYASHPPAEKVLSKRLEEMVYDTSAQALRAAGVERSELDHVTLATCDELDGRSISSMLMVAPAGGYLKDELKVTDAGMVGLHLAAMRIATGRYGLGLLASWNKTSKAPFEDVMRMRCEPFFTRPIGLNAAIADGLFAQAQCEAGKASEAQASAASAKLQRAAASNPRGLQRKAAADKDIAASPYIATPLREGHRAPVSDGAVSIVLASGDWLKRNPQAKPLARVAGDRLEHRSLLPGPGAARRPHLLQAGLGRGAAAGRRQVGCRHRRGGGGLPDGLPRARLRRRARPG